MDVLVEGNTIARMGASITAPQGTRVIEADGRLKKMIDAGVYPGPRIYPSGAYITQTSGHADFRSPLEVPRPYARDLTPQERMGIMIVADGKPAVIQRVRENLMKGAAQIKLLAGGGVASPSDPLDVSQYTQEELEAAVEVAESWNTYVAVHAYAAEAVQNALRAGVRSIEHGQLMDDETAQMIQQSDAWVCMQPFLDDEDAIPFPPGSFSALKYQQLVSGTDNAYGLVKKYDLNMGFGTDTQNGAGDRERAEELLAELRAAVPDDPRVPQFEFALRLFFGDLDAARAELRERFREATGGLGAIAIEPAMIPRVWELLAAVPSEGEVRITDFKSTIALAAGRQQEALDLWKMVPRGNGVRVTLARHHQDLVGDWPGFDPDAEYTLDQCSGLGNRMACREKVALHDVDQGRFAEARAAIAFQDSAAAVDTLQSRILIRRRVARFVEGYMAWKRGDIDGALESLGEARRMDRFAVTARWFMAQVLTEAGRPREAVELFLSIDDSPTWSPFSRLRAAEVLEGMGDVGRAAELYRSSLSAWVGADEGFEPKERAEAGLARPEAEGEAHGPWPPREWFHLRRAVASLRTGRPGGR